MNVEIGAEATLFPEKEYIKGIFVAVCLYTTVTTVSLHLLAKDDISLYTTLILFGWKQGERLIHGSIHMTSYCAVPWLHPTHSRGDGEI